jgi:hypothetical protein
MMGRLLFYRAFLPFTFRAVGYCRFWMLVLGFLASAAAVVAALSSVRVSSLALCWAIYFSMSWRKLRLSLRVVFQAACSTVLSVVLSGVYPVSSRLGERTGLSLPVVLCSQ